MSNAGQGTEYAELRVSLPPPALEELKELSARSGRTLDKIVQTALGLAKLAFDETRNGNVLVVAKSDGTPIKRIVLS